MGLDAVELIIEIEDEFQISISDEEAFKCETPNLLTDLVYSRLRKSTSEVCPSMRGFYIVKKVLIEQLDIPERRIKPETKLDDIINKENRVSIWKNLLSTISNGSTIHAPLERPSRVTNSILASTILVFLLLIFAMKEFISPFILTCFFHIILNASTKSLCTEFPNKFLLVKDLTRIISTLETKVLSRDEVYDLVKDIIIDQLGIKEDKIQPDSHFIKDLGID